MKTIPLTRGMVALVDDEDFEFLSQWKWHAKISKGLFYAARSVRIGQKTYFVYMHRVLKGAVDGQSVDHADRVTLNNQKRNLRFGSPGDNMANTKLRKDSTSGFKGVTWHKTKCRWIAQLRVKGKAFHIGTFKTPKEAAVAYDKAAKTYFGAFAATNENLRN